MNKPIKMIIAAFILLFLGAILPFLMVVGIIEAAFFLSFLSRACSFIGLIIGFIGMAKYLRTRR